MRVLLVLISFCYFGSLAGQTSPVIKDKSRIVPFGCVKMPNSFLFIDETEVSNIQYRECLNWLKENDTSLYKKMLPDTHVWKQKLAYNEPFVRYYFNHSAYQDYPVVGITFLQAQLFCKWRTDRVLEYYKTKVSQ